MARIAGGMDELEWARERVTKARSAEDLRQAQAVLLPLELGLSLEQTASAIGRSVSMTCKLRNRRRRELAQELEPKKHKHQLRNHAHASLELEAAALDQVLAGAAKGGIVIIPQLPPAMAGLVIGALFIPCLSGLLPIMLLGESTRRCRVPRR